MLAVARRDGGARRSRAARPSPTTRGSPSAARSPLALVRTGHQSGRAADQGTAARRTALVRPSAAVQRIDQVERRLRRRLSLPATATAGASGSRWSSSLLGTDVVPADAVERSPTPLPGFCSHRAGPPAARRRASRGELQTVLRGLPHNVTTEMDLELWDLRERCAPTRRRPRRSATRRGRAGPAIAAGTLPRVAQRGMTALPAPTTATGPSPRSTSACRAGPTTRPTSSVCSPTTSARRSRRWPRTAQFAAGRGRGRGDDRRPWSGRARRGRPARGAPGRLRAGPGPAAGRPAGEPEVLADRRARPAPRTELGNVGERAGAAGARSTRPTTSSSSTSHEARAGLAGDRPAAGRRGTRERYARELRAGTSRGSCSPTAPSRRPSPARPTQPDGALPAARRRPAR